MILYCIVIYMLGTWIAYYTLPRIVGIECHTKTEYETLFILSSFSWVCFIILGIWFIMVKTLRLIWQ